jgi:hypothetical protein
MLPERSQDGIDPAMSLHRSQAGEGCGHDPQSKVPLAGGTGVSGVRRAVISHLELARLQLLAQQLLDAARGVRTRWHAGSVTVGVRAHALLGLTDSMCAVSQAAWTRANTMNAALRPNTLKSTQMRSLMLAATARLAAPSSA